MDAGVLTQGRRRALETRETRRLPPSRQILLEQDGRVLGWHGRGGIPVAERIVLITLKQVEALWRTGMNWAHEAYLVESGAR
jgi:hypothetical protein